MSEYRGAWPSRGSGSGVDVRYIMWLVGTYDKATHLVDEMVGPTP